MHPRGTSQAALTRRLTLGLVTFATALALVWLGGELYYRFLFDSTDSFGLTRVSRRWFERHYAPNNIGVRDNVDYRPERTPGLRRVTFLGDSFTAGHGIANVDDRFANRIRARHTLDWEVHVIAANGADTGGELNDFAQLLAAGYAQEVVVLVYVLNDIADLVPEWESILARIYAEQGREPFLVRHSDFLNMLYYRLKAARDPDLANYYGFVRAAYASPLWDAQQQRLAALSQACRERGIRLLVVTFPFLHALGPDYAYADVHRRLDAFWNAQGVPHLDLLDTFAAVRDQPLVIGAYDAHPNALAHRIAADTITAFLEAQLPVALTPQPAP